MPKTDYDRIIALAGLFQASHLVRQIARSGQADAGDFATCIDSLFKIDAASSEAVYGEIPRLKTGLELVARQLSNPQDAEITRYVLTLLAIERKLRKKPPLLNAIRSALDLTISKLSYFPATHENTLASLADTYQQTISTIKPRVMVNGEHMHLTRPENANRIRALLLAGVRAAILWRQNGGNWFVLIFRRKAMAAETRRLLASLRPHPADA